MACPHAVWRLRSPAMDVLNSIKVTVPPELREMLLEFVICYLIDRPTDPHSYAAAHFLYQQKLRHSYLVKYPYTEPSKTAVEDDAVETAVAPEPEEESHPSEARNDDVVSTMSLGVTRIMERKSKSQAFKKAVRIDESSLKAPAKDATGSAMAVATHSVARLVDTVMAAVEQATTQKGKEVEEQATQPKEGEEAPMPKEQNRVLDAFTTIVAEDEGGLSHQVSAPQVAARSVIDVLHSTYQSVAGLRRDSSKNSVMQQEAVAAEQ